jgi:hypothetical protein
MSANLEERNSFSLLIEDPHCLPSENDARRYDHSELIDAEIQDLLGP